MRRKLPSMYEQFKELADVDITAGPMEVGPTMHYMMGGIRVDADTGATTTPGLYAAGEVAAGLHGSNRLGGNSLTDLLVFGRRAGEAAVEATAAAGPVARGAADLPSDFVAESLAAMAAPFERRGEDPNRLHADLQETMSSLVGIFRTESDLADGHRGASRATRRAGDGLARDRPAALQPGLGPRLRAAQHAGRLGGHRPLARWSARRAAAPTAASTTRACEPEWDVVNVAVGRADGAMVVRQTPTRDFPAELRQYVTAGADAAKD